MKLKCLEANMWAHLQYKLPDTDRGFFSFLTHRNIGTNTDYIDERCGELQVKINKLIRLFGRGADVAELYSMGILDDIPVEVLKKAMEDRYGKEVNMALKIERETMLKLMEI